MLAFLLTNDNVTYFYFYVHSFGMCWTIPFVICMLLIGFPLAYLEMALGQYTSTGVFLVFARMAPGFSGLGVAVLFLNFFVATFDQVVFNEGMLVASESILILNNEMPWHNCIGEHSGFECHTWYRECQAISKGSDIPQYPSMMRGGGREYEYSQMGDTCVRVPTRPMFVGINDRVTKSREMTVAFIGFLHSEIDNFERWEQYTYPSHSYIGFSFLAAMICILVLNSPRQVVVLIFTLSTLLAICVISFLLHGMLFLFVPAEPRAGAMEFLCTDGYVGYLQWLSALVLTFRCLKLGQGAWTYFGSHCGFHNNLILDCMVLTIIVIIVTYVNGLFHTIAIDSYVEVIRKQYGVTSIGSMIIFHNPTTMVTRLLSAAFIFGHFEPVVSLIYSSMVIFTTITNKMMRIIIVLASFLEVDPSFSDRYARFCLVVVIVLFNMLVQFFFTAKNSFIRLAAISYMVYPFVSAVLVFIEVGVIGLFYGYRVFFSNTSVMAYGGTKKTESKRLKLLLNVLTMIDWVVVVPISCICMIASTIFYDYYQDVSFMDLTNWLIVLVLLSPIPAMLVVTIAYQVTSGNSIYPLFKRNPDLWGPRLRANRDEAERAERRIRQWW
ncbi:hypothetical protein Q1695_010204 [Nippostrongylus brasiliensis]|nr:hypothetical protein Q1695_010204 [Nippostrongylus brasiliensis]